MEDKKESALVTRTACPACRGARDQSVSDSPNYSLCPFCGVVYRASFELARPEDGWDESYYADERVVNYYLKRYSGVRTLVRLMNRLTGGRGRWLDVGCGVGVLLEVASEQGWKVAGIDTSRIAVEVARRRLEQADIALGMADEELHRFRGVTVVSLTDVLRTMLRPDALLESVRDVLREGGWALVREVNGEKSHRIRKREAPGIRVTSTMSLQEWSPISLENCLRRAGFRNVYTLPSPAFVETNESERDTRNGLKIEMKKMMKRGVWPASRIVHRLSGGHFYFGPNFIALGQK